MADKRITIPPEDKRSITVRILRIGEVVYEGRAWAVTSVDEKGVFDILALHANLIALVNKHLVIHEMNGQDREFTIDSGVLRNSNNQVDIFLGIRVDVAQKELPQAPSIHEAPPPPPLIGKK